MAKASFWTKGLSFVLFLLRENMQRVHLDDSWYKWMYELKFYLSIICGIIIFFIIFIVNFRDNTAQWTYYSILCKNYVWLLCKNNVQAVMAVESNDNIT